MTDLGFRARMILCQSLTLVSQKIVSLALMRGFWRDRSSTTGVPGTQEPCGFTEEWDAGRHGSPRRSIRRCVAKQSQKIELLPATFRTLLRLPIPDR
jgi:hypothetical protein